MTAEPYNPYFSQLDDLQKAHTEWLAKLGSQPVCLQMRLRRFAEEAAELCQAAGLDEETFIKVARDSYSRPIGETGQEIGGTMVTLLCLAGVTEHSVDAEARREFERINTPEMIEKIAAKQAVKAARGI